MSEREHAATGRWTPATNWYAIGRRPALRAADTNRKIICNLLPTSQNRAHVSYKEIATMSEVQAPKNAAAGQASDARGPAVRHQCHIGRALLRSYPPRC